MMHTCTGHAAWDLHILGGLERLLLTEVPFANKDTRRPRDLQYILASRDTRI